MIAFMTWACGHGAKRWKNSGVSDQFPHTATMIVDTTSGFHFRPESLGFLLAWNDPEERPGYKTEFEASFIEKILKQAADRVSCFEALAVNRKLACDGLSEMTLEHHRSWVRRQTYQDFSWLTVSAGTG
jgi:hypothetical protein